MVVLKWENKVCIPFPEVTSSHPWSVVFMYWCDTDKGIDIINCDDRGTKCHIEHEE